MTDKSLLIVDDDPRICRLIKRVASNLGFDTTVLEDSEKFIPSYIQVTPSIIMLDLKMKGLDGVELIRYLSTLESESIIIIMSGVENKILETTMRLGESLGLHMAAAIQKPLDIDKIKDLLMQQYERLNQDSITENEVTLEDLLEAISDNGIQAYYQPQINLQTNQVVGVEALCRWIHPEKGIISPASFIPMAEKFGVIKPLTEAMLRHSIRDYQTISAQIPNVQTAVNLSAKLLSDLSLPDSIDSMLKAGNMKNANLLMEVTETAAMEDPSITMEILTRLRLKEISIAMDDFGTGYSSLVQLYRLPFSQLKIDISFVVDLIHSEEADAIVNSTINIAHTLGLEVVGEGIENQETLTRLKELGCDIGQGYFIARPMPLEELMDWTSQFAQSA